jgi:DNA processing protein
MVWGDTESRGELAAWVGLLALDGLGNETFRGLLKVFGSVQSILSAPTSALAQATRRPLAETIAQLQGALAGRATDGSAKTAAELAHQTLAWLDQTPADGPPRDVITLGDARYPGLLLEAPDPPSVLYALGQLEVLDRPALAIVGSRNATAQGVENARQFAASLSAAGLSIVSGLALGIDAAAHEGGLSGVGGTIAVVGTGLDRVYPARHRDLAHRIASTGLILSEFPLGTPPLAAHFPKRNRIIAGLSRGTLVVEAALGSGSLITAKLAAECSREVFAIPGSIHAPQARGCHWLIKQGAKLVDQAQDVLDELSLPAGTAANPHRTEPADSSGRAHDPNGLLAAMGHDAATLDALAARTGLDAGRLTAELLELELAGEVARLPGGLFQRVVRA